MRHMRLNLTLVAALALGACSRGDAGQPLADDLQRDLDMAGGTAVELAPRAGGQQVVSAIESTPAVPRPRPVQKAPQRTPTPKPDPTPAPAPAPVLAAADPEPAEAPAPVEARPVEAVGGGRPAPVATQRKAPPGGWRSVSEVIRNSPIPINP